MYPPRYLQENNMATTKEATKKELIKELKERGFVTDNQFSQNDPLMDAIAAAITTILTRDAEVIVTSGSSAGTYKIT